MTGTQSMQFFTCELTFILLSRRRFEMSLWEVCWYENYYQCSTLCRSLDKTSHFSESKEILIWMLLWRNEKEEISLNWAMQLLITLTNISFMSWHNTFRGCGACWAGGRYLASSQSKRESVKYQTNGSNHFFISSGKRTKKSDNKHQGTNHRKPKTNTGPWCSGQHLSQLVRNRRNLILGRKHCWLQKKSHSLFKQNCIYDSLRKKPGKTL